MCINPESLCSRYAEISDIFQTQGDYWHDLTTVKILLSRTLQTENQQLIGLENYLYACILIQALNPLKNSIQISCQIRLVHEMMQIQDSHYLLELNIVLETSLSTYTVFQALNVCMTTNWLSGSKYSNTILHGSCPRTAKKATITHAHITGTQEVLCEACNPPY